MPIGAVKKYYQENTPVVPAHKDGQNEKGSVPPNRQVERGGVNPPAGNRQVERGSTGGIKHQVEMGRPSGKSNQNNEVERFGEAGRDRPKPL